MTMSLLWNDWREWFDNDHVMFATLITGLHFVFYFGISAVYWLFWELKWCQRYKIIPSKFPDKKRLLGTAKDILIFNLALFPVGSYFVLYPLLAWRVGGTDEFMNGYHIPSLGTVIAQLVVMFFLSDAARYWLHLLFHESTFLYKNYHKYHHSYNVCTGIVASHNHPVEAVCLGLADCFCEYLVGLHAFTFCLWKVFEIICAMEIHGGYNFPFSPLVGWADRHSFHHSHNQRCYGTSPIWDWIMGTDKEYLAWKASQQAATSKKSTLQKYAS